MYDIVNDMIKYPVKCKIDQVYNEGESVISILAKNNCHDLVHRISGLIMKIKVLRTVVETHDNNATTDINIEDIDIDKIEDASDITINYTSGANATKINL